MKKYLSLILLFISFNVKSHEINPAVADFIILEDTTTIYFNMNAEALIAGIDLSEYNNTDDAPEFSEYNYFRAFKNDALEKLIFDMWDDFSKKIIIKSNNQSLKLDLVDVDIGTESDIEIPRDTILKIKTKIDNNFEVIFDKSFGPVVIRQFQDYSKESLLFSEYLQPGEESPIMSATNITSSWVVAIDYLIVGVEHIIPKGLDHILFVLGLFFYSIKLKPLLMQVTMFTFAHSLTLILATFNFILIPPNIVEPLIALSISYVAFENIFKKKFKFYRNNSLTRYSIIFIFGLIHGLGFAFVLKDIGLDTNQLFLSLFSFNIGVELAQIGIIVSMYFVMIIPSKKEWYKNLIQMPISLLIGLIGFYWFIERVFF